MGGRCPPVPGCRDEGLSRVFEPVPVPDGFTSDEEGFDIVMFLEGM